MSRAFWSTGSIALVLICNLLAVWATNAQEPAGEPEAEPTAKPPSLAVEIADEPTGIDPATLIPAPLAQAVTVDLTAKSLRELFAWLQTELKLSVRVDQATLVANGVVMGEMVNDRSDNAPLYLLLNRLNQFNVGWYWQDDALRITSLEQAKNHSSSVYYNIGDLLDAGFEGENFRYEVMRLSGGGWEDHDGGMGSSVLLGDVLFVRNSDEVQLQIAGLMAAIRHHGRRTLVLDPPSHHHLRQKLDEAIEVHFEETPLTVAIQQLGQLAKVDIRADVSLLNHANSRAKGPITLKLSSSKLKNVLNSILDGLSLTWTIRDNVIWICPQDAAGNEQLAAVFDVRDLCRDEDEASALLEAIENQSTFKWQERDGTGGVLCSPKPGVLIIRQRQLALDETLALLEAYRGALRASKPRSRKLPDPKELLTRHYRMPVEMADDLKLMLPRLVSPKSWRTEGQPDAVGTIDRVRSRPTWLSDAGAEGPAAKGSSPFKTTSVLQENAVLIIHNTRAVHEEIGELIHKIEIGDPTRLTDDSSKQQGGLGMGGQGGFGGGFFSMPSE